MREEFTEHEGVVGFGVVLGEVNVLVHVECDDILKAARSRDFNEQSISRRRTFEVNGVPYLSFPSFTRLIKYL